MAIRATYERHPDLGCEAVVFQDEDSDGCFQIQRDLPGGPRAGEYCLTTGAGAPVYGAVIDWRRVSGTAASTLRQAQGAAEVRETAERFEFHLTPRAAR
ncbi:MAG: hypothetical protein QM658_17175, partial [Gordonia sp. (in: high G+C Gram-positive bacteria)]